MSKPSDRITEYLKTNGIKQSFVSQKTRINDSTLSAKLRGQIRITADDIEVICGALGCVPDDFLKPKNL
jgi:transcriptional regulator with XRE-family HTH domain